MKNYKRSIINNLESRLSSKNPLIQVLLGPRQVGKTTLIRQFLEDHKQTDAYHSADAIGGQSQAWVEQIWNQARRRVSQTSPTFLVIDEVQKIPNWSEIVKKFFDEDRFKKTKLNIILLGSSQNLIQEGLSESLAGRFEVIPVPHWSYQEMKNAFDYTIDEYIFFGGYPGAADFKNDHQRWLSYINESLIETTLAKDLLQSYRIEKPALLRATFELACVYSGKILSFQKMLGQLQDAGNTTTVSHYLKLLDSICLVKGIEKFSPQVIRQRASSPKLLVYNTGLISAILKAPFKSTVADAKEWGHYVESAIGAHILNQALTGNFKVHYWNDGIYEVDFVLSYGKSIIAIEVKSGTKTEQLSGLEKFKKQFPKAQVLLVGKNGIEISKFLTTNILDLF